MDSEDEKVLLAKGKVITDAALAQMPFSKWSEISVEGDDDVERELSEIFDSVGEQEDMVRMMYDQKISRLTKGDELPPGVIKVVKVYVAIKRKLSVGDKMAGRHGNKGVISRILPEEDMPYMEDGRPVDVVLNPLGVPSRMNVGQILEVHMGWAAKELGEKLQAHIEKNYSRDELVRQIKKAYNSPSMDEFLEKATESQIKEMARKVSVGVPLCTPVFDGASEPEVKEMLRDADLPLAGQATLFDGRTGLAFDQPVTVGLMYIMKLHHLVDEKIHARSIGPYSLVTQQPLGGKAQFGGQRLGEMEVWALEAYGAAYSLQEFLTVKSDDVAGRTRMYEAIVKGEKVLEPGLPESFNVLIKELQSLCLDVDLMEPEK